MGILKDEVVTGKEEKPATILAHGHPGTGKSTFASSLGKVIVASKDGGLSEIDCAKVPMEGQGTAKLVDLMRELATENTNTIRAVLMVLNIVKQMQSKKCVRQTVSKT